MTVINAISLWHEHKIVTVLPSSLGTSEHPIDDFEGELVGDVQRLATFRRGQQLRIANAPARWKMAAHVWVGEQGMQREQPTSVGWRESSRWRRALQTLCSAPR